MGKYVIANRLAGKSKSAERKSARASLDSFFSAQLAASVNVVADSATAMSASDTEERRRVVVFEGDPDEVAAKQSLCNADLMMEPELPRRPAVSMPAEIQEAFTTMGDLPPPPGSGAGVGITIRGDGQPQRGVAVSLFLVEAGQPQRTASVRKAVTDANGTVRLDYDPRFTPTGALIEPAGGFWSTMVPSPQDGATFDLQALPKTGPLGYWHQLVGMNTPADTRGEGIKIGVVDTGVGPHPYLSHVKSLGAFLNGSFDPNGGADARDHGTHVSGIIAARPAGDSGDFVGIAQGADVIVARVFTETAGGNQGDIANAIDALAIEEQADLINLSLGAAQPSEIERDAIVTAVEVGTLCVCAAGNENGRPVSYPAAYPDTVAVSAIGLEGTSPPGTLASMNVPTGPDAAAKRAANGLYLASFSNVGPQMTCTAPGVGLLSTVPARFGLEAPYASMSGTSMATPAACAALATLLSADQQYRAMPRNQSRAGYAAVILSQTAVSIGLAQPFQGYGISRAMP